MADGNLLRELVVRAQDGDLEAFGRLVRKTQAMAYAAAKGVLRDRGLAEDAAQEAFLRAYRRLRDLDEPRGFGAWLRRIVITVALNMRRASRHTFLRLDDVPEVPVLDEEETTWSDIQRQRLAGAILTLTDDERRLCDRRYHGQWSTSRLAREAGVDEGVIRKRLQRLRDKLRREIEVAEQRGIGPDEIRPDFPGKVIELLSRPKLTDLPENPVGKVLELLQSAWEDFTETELDEIVDFEEASRTIGKDALYIERSELHRVDDRRILRYDLTLPLLLSVMYTGHPLKLRAAGKAYRLGRVDALHLEAFHSKGTDCCQRARFGTAERVLAVAVPHQLALQAARQVQVSGEYLARICLARSFVTITLGAAGFVAGVVSVLLRLPRVAWTAAGFPQIAVIAIARRDLG